MVLAVKSRYHASIKCCGIISADFPYIVRSILVFNISSWHSIICVSLLSKKKKKLNDSLFYDHNIIHFLNKNKLFICSILPTIEPDNIPITQSKFKFYYYVFLQQKTLYLHFCYLIRTSKVLLLCDHSFFFFNIGVF